MIPQKIEHIIKASKDPRIPKYLLKKEDEPIIEVSEITSQAAFLYEKLRNAVDYKEEHLIRRAALERILKRKIALNLKSDKIARSLIAEFIRAGYLPNNEIPERIAENLQHIIDRHLALLKKVGGEGIEKTIGLAPFFKPIMSLAATEIERFLFSHSLEDATLNAFYTSIKDRVSMPDQTLTDTERDLTIYLAAARSLFKSDDATLYYDLFTTYYPDWYKADDALITHIAGHLPQVHETIKAHLDDRLPWQLVPKLKNDAIYFSLIKELAETKPGTQLNAIVQDPLSLRKEITTLANKRYEAEKGRVTKSSWRAVIYVFFTKIILAFIFELPYDLIVEKKITYTPLLINVFFHPLLLFAVTSSVKNPPSNNTDIIVNGIQDIVDGKPLKKILLQKRGYGSFLNILLAFVYIAMFFVTFAIIAQFLRAFHFNIVSGFLFIFFLTLISYFGIRIRYTAKTWHVVGGKENPISFIWDLFTLPIVQVGRWLSEKFAAINVFIFIMDFIIEAPFKLMLEVFEEFISFVREKKEEMY